MMTRRILTATALAAIMAMPAFAGQEVAAEDVTAAINQPVDHGTALNNLEPSAGSTSNTTSNTTSDTMMNSTTNTMSNSLSSTPSNVTTTTASTTVAQPVAVLDQKMAMRKLFEEHGSYMRNFLVSDIGGLRDEPEVNDRLLKNSDDIGAAVKVFYDDDTGNRLSTLMRGHVQASEDLIKAEKSKNQKGIDDAKAKAAANADEIATFLNGANTNLSKDDIANALKQHIDSLASEAEARVKKDFKSDIDAHDQGREQLLTLSDMIVDGIAKQYPEKLTTTSATTLSPSSIEPATGP